MLLDQKVAIVTGADSGIGRGIAIQFAKEGATVVVNYAHAQDKAEEVRQIIEQNKGQALVIQADVSQYQQAMGLIQQTVEHFNRLDIMVNNAGMEIHSPFLDVTEEQWDRVLNVDLKGAFFCAQAAAREMVQRKTAGRIINISSVHEDLAMPQNAPILRQRRHTYDDAHHLPGTGSLQYHRQQHCPRGPSTHQLTPT